MTHHLKINLFSSVVQIFLFIVLSVELLQLYLQSFYWLLKKFFSIYIFIFPEIFLICWFLLNYSNCSFCTEVIFLFNSLRTLMIISLLFLCTQHYVCFIRIIIFCLFILVLSFMLEVFSTEFLLSVHGPPPGTFWSISQGVFVLTPFITFSRNCGSRVITY